MEFYQPPKRKLMSICVPVCNFSCYITITLRLVFGQVKILEFISANQSFIGVALVGTNSWGNLERYEKDALMQ